MVLKVLLVITIILQCFAAVVALRLTKVTKYNMAWILLTLALLLLVVRRLAEFMPYISDFQPQDFRLFFVWMGVFTSLFLATGVFLIQKVFKYIRKVEAERRDTEKRFLNAIIQAEERERRNIARELHDGFGPLLSTVKISLSTLNQAPLENAEKENLANTEMVLDEAIRSLREISNNLSPHVLTNFGLARALKGFINKINTTKTIRILFTTNLQDERFDPNTEVILYRVVCELINNTMKHAGASRINLDINYQKGEILMRYSDNGSGFDVARVTDDPGHGMGFSNIFSRINSLKGSLHFDSAPGQGIQVTIRVST